MTLFVKGYKNRHHFMTRSHVWHGFPETSEGSEISMSWQALVYQWKAQNTFRLDPDSTVIARDENRKKGAKCIKNATMKQIRLSQLTRH